MCLPNSSTFDCDNISFGYWEKESTGQDFLCPVLLLSLFEIILSYIALPITSPMVSAASRIISGVAWV